MAMITKDTYVGDLLKISPSAASVLAGIGMLCLGCPSARGETIAEAAEVHGVDADKLVEVINNKIAEEKEK